MSLTKLAHNIQSNTKIECYESIKKRTERFLKNIYSALGINLSTYIGGKGYILDEWLTNYLTTHIDNYNIPTQKTVKESFMYADEFSVEYLDVIKHFNNANFTGDTYEKIKNEVITAKEKIYNDFLMSIQSQQKAAESFNKFTFALIGRKLSLSELDIFIAEVKHHYKEITTSENEPITEKDIMLIDFLRLPNILKNVHNELSKEIISNNISKLYN